MRRMRLWMELVGLFLGLPVLLASDLVPGHKIIWLGLATLGCVVWLLADPGYSRRDLVAAGARPDLGGLAARILVVAVLLVGLVFMLHPDSFFEFPRSRPRIWLMVMVLYPLLSAYPQEIIYRGFFFRRYAPLFPNGTAMVLASAGAFAFLHVMYDNAVSLALSLAGGCLFAAAYRKNGSLFWTSVEHAVYGMLVFSIGLGRYFYEGPR